MLLVVSLLILADSTDSLRRAAEGLKPPSGSRLIPADTSLKPTGDSKAYDELLKDIFRATGVLLAYSVVGDPRRRIVPLREIRAGEIHTTRDLYQGFFLEGRALDFPGGMGGFALGASWLHFENEKTVLVVGLGGLVWTLGNRYFPLILAGGLSYADANIPGYPLWGLGGYAEIEPFHQALPVWPVVRYEHHAYTQDVGYKRGNLWGWSWGVQGRIGPVTFFYLFRDLRAGGEPLVFRVMGLGVAG